MIDKKEIWIWNPFFLPGYKGGGPVQSLNNLSKYISKDFNIKIVTKNRDFGEKQPYKDIIPNTWIKQKDYQIMYLKYSSHLINLIRLISKEKPNLLYCNGYFSIAMFVIVILNKIVITKSKVIVAPRGEFHQEALSLKSLKKKFYFMVFKPLCKGIIFHSTTELEELLIRKFFKTNLIFICHNFPTIPDEKNIENPSLKIANYLRVLFLSRICVNKNLLFAIEVINSINFTNKIIFNIVGPVEDNNYWAECKSLMDSAPGNITFNYIGPQSHDDACQNYLINDLCFLPTFFEAVSHVINEALLHGCPVLTSDNTPWENGEFSTGIFAFNLKDREKFIDTINRFCDLSSEEHINLRGRAKNYAIQKLNISETIEEYKSMFNYV